MNNKASEVEMLNNATVTVNFDITIMARVSGLRTITADPVLSLLTEPAN